jgi:hypothetical protein
MGGIFSRGPMQKAIVETVQAVPKTEPAATPAASTPAPAAGLGETRAPVTRASTMLSNRRAGEDARVGTKKLLGQ